MNRLPRFGLLQLLAMSVTLFLVGCPQKQDQATDTSAQAGTQDTSSDPASANLAPADSGTVTPAANTQQSAPQPSSGSYNQAPSQGSSQASNQGEEDPGYGAQPVEYAPQPPPVLPDYEQPPAPGDGYIWTPGYWGYAPGGYYWTPGVWVQAPYEGALWTPGYWGYYHHRYGFYRGYWGPHIGYYGGIDYGFGYIGFGYQGGYWGGGHFNYNRSFNNMNGSRAQFIYNRPMSDNHRGGLRVSFNGGSGGLQVRARPAELAARHEQHAPPMRAQLQNEHLASSNRAQFANVNHGRPASLAVNRPIAADRNVRMPAEVKAHNQPAAEHQQRQAAPMHQQQHQTAPMQQQHRAAPMQQRKAAPQQQHRAAPQQQHRTAPQQHQAQPERKTEEHPKQ